MGVIHSTKIPGCLKICCCQMGCNRSERSGSIPLAKQVLRSVKKKDVESVLIVVI